MTQLEYLCKIKSRSIYEGAMHSLNNHPFVNTPINQGIINDCIEFEIKQKHGAAILKEFIKNNNFDTPQLHSIVINRIKWYQNKVIRAFLQSAQYSK